ncbi:ParB/RepB/Spo0J family partition protein [Armatimonas rosea]|uniref:ParB-like chromosome segregation protein Spo0J n=1 Tax=Armatimonas rosea TaxID=685828 RepID=A0A7W9SUX4_ARMRO|nr:ParB N-terminal domain-containing protein [Armatimonas rosea]MBB6053322.1 ParB-like chromosome segregation protein Spo0J [Armatimonas rosea]
MIPPVNLSLPLEEMDNNNRHIGPGVFPLAAISERPGHNPRKDYGEHDGSFASLVESIKQFGMIQPPVIIPTSTAGEAWFVVSGHRRIAAARAAGMEEVRCIELGWDWTTDESGKDLAKDTLASYTETEQSIYALIENLQRKELNCIEVAEGVHSLERLGKTQEEIGRWIGRSQGAVSKLSRLLTLPDGVRAYLRTGELSQSHGEELLPLLGESFLTGEIETLASRAVEQGLTANGLRHVVREKVERATPKQVTLEEYSAPNDEGFDSELDARIARTLAGTKGLDKSELGSFDKDPKPMPRDDNGLTRKESDKEFAAAMAPDPDVVPLSELPAPKPSPEVQARISLGKWLDEIGLNWIEAAGRLCDITGPGGDVHKPGMWIRLEPETALKLMELCDWHLQEHGDIAGSAMGAKLNDVVNSFHAAKLEMRSEADAAKQALSATLPVFEEPAPAQTKPLTPSEAGEKQRQKELADQQAAQKKKAQRQAEHEARAAEKAKTDVTFRVSYCYPQHGEWQGGGECETLDGFTASFKSLVEARAFAAEESARNPRFLVHVTIWTEHIDRQSDRCQQRGDLWFFRGQSVPGGVSNSIPSEESLAVVGCVLSELYQVEGAKDEEDPGDPANFQIFPEAQTTRGLVDDMAGRLV